MIDELQYNVVTSPVRFGRISLLAVQISDFSLEQSGIGCRFYGTAVDELSIGNAQTTYWYIDCVTALIGLFDQLLQP